ncbi:MAG: hypothetical protein FWF59_15395 [Turicibacter sp.]|nr:hypothetical protein [Turicibacter sp.]
MERKFRVVVAAHDKKKEELVKFLKENRHAFEQFELLTTRGIGMEIHKRTKIRVTYLNPEPGRAQSELMLLLSKRAIDGVIFLRESVSLYSYELSINEINLACDEYDLPMATNIQTAKAVLGQLRGGAQQAGEKSIKFTYDHLISVFEGFKSGMLEEIRQELASHTQEIKALQLPKVADPDHGQLVPKMSKEEEMKEILAHLHQEQKANAYVLRKRFGMGYNRAVKIINALEEQNYIGPAGPDGNREVFIKASDLK